MPLIRPARVGLSLALAVLAATPIAHADPNKEACINANEGAQPLRQSGKLRAAREKLLVCVSKSCPAAVRDDCGERLAEVEKATPTVVFAAKNAAGGDLVEVRVTMDGALLVERLDGTAIALDPGAHAFVFEAPGIGRVEESLVIREGEKQRPERVVLGAAAARPAGEAPAPAATPKPEPPPAPANGGGPNHVPAFIALGVGVVGVAVGSIFGALALGTKSTLDGQCTHGACPASAQGDIDSLHSNSTLSTVGFGVGVGGLAVGGALWLLAGSGDGDKHAQAGVRPWIGLGSAGLQGSY